METLGGKVSVVTLSADEQRHRYEDKR